MTTQVQNLPQLAGDNFNNWKFRVQVILEEKHVIDTLTKSQSDFIDDKEKKEFVTRDSKTKSVIVQCVSDKHLDFYRRWREGTNPFRSGPDDPANTE